MVSAIDLNVSSLSSKPSCKNCFWTADFDIGSEQAICDRYQHVQALFHRMKNPGESGWLLQVTSFDAILHLTTCYVSSDYFKT